MQASTTGTPTGNDFGTIFVSTELSQKSWLITVHSPDQERMSRYKLDGGDHAGLLALAVKIRRRATQKRRSDLFRPRLDHPAGVIGT